MQIFGLAGWSGSGKTTLVTRLVPVLIRQGLSVSTLKHAHHDFDVDQEGKDSWWHRQAGAREVMVASDRRWALMHELRGAPEPKMDEILRHMSPVDLVLVEGYKRGPHPKLEVYRAALGKTLLAEEDETIIGIASDMPVSNDRLPFFDLDDVEGIAAFVIAHCGLKVVEDGAAQR